MWIAYSIPRIEDGNNFGVSIQVNEQFTVFIMASICIKNCLYIYQLLQDWLCDMEIIF